MFVFFFATLAVSVWVQNGNAIEFDETQSETEEHCWEIEETEERITMNIKGNCGEEGLIFFPGKDKARDVRIVFSKGCFISSIHIC